MGYTCACNLWETETGLRTPSLAGSQQETLNQENKVEGGSAGPLISSMRTAPRDPHKKEDRKRKRKRENMGPTGNLTWGMVSILRKSDVVLWE